MVVGSLVGGEVVEGHCEEGVERGAIQSRTGVVWAPCRLHGKYTK